IRASARSVLLTTRITGMSAFSALRSTNRVCGSGPSEASTSSAMPSTMDRPRSTSPPKSACPGVSMMLKVTPPSGAPSAFHRTAVFLARMVMPFSRSRSPESIARSSTCWCSPKEPVCQSMASTRVVLPWSTWATIAMLRRSSRVRVGMRAGSIRSRRGDSPPSLSRAGAGALREQGANDRPVPRQPRHVEPFPRAEHPQLVVVLDRRGDAADDPDPPHPHPVRRWHRPAVALRTGHLPTDLHLDAQLLGELAVQRLQWRLAGLDLAARQLPASGEARRLGPACGEERRGVLQVVQHRRAHDEYRRSLCAHGGSVPHPATSRASRGAKGRLAS